MTSSLEPAAPEASETSAAIFDSFVRDAVITAAAITEDQSVVTPTHPLLNGVPYAVFRRSIGIDTRRELGAFFSGDVIAKGLVQALAPYIDDNALVLDPTCGIGDLLLARAAILPLATTLTGTLSAWGDRLAGFDIRPDLIDLCKARLCMLARARGGFVDDINPLKMFPHIVARSMFAEDSADLLSRAEGILFNPPFGKTTSDREHDWGSGQINAAAIFLDHLTTSVPAGTPIAAVLPEVLRCGSRYARFRSALVARGYAGDFQRQGRFDSWTDVDVFTTVLARSADVKPLWPAAAVFADSVLDDFYEVRVGTVVPHRDIEAGPESAYICAKTTPKWSEGFTPLTRRRHPGRAFTPPFVAIRRTSSPSDKSRAVASIIVGDTPVAVENHLLVATPRDHSLAACQALLTVLRSSQTNDRLNDLMRCRHLTTGAVKALPWSLPDE